MNDQISNKIRFISFVLILLVLYIHSNFHNYEIEGMDVNNYTQIFISDLLGRCAVPMFYIISGYLFFSTAKNIEAVFDKMKKRFKTLMIPYFIGCLFFISFFIILRYIPGVSKFMNSNLSEFFNEPLKVIIYKTFVNSGGGSPMAFHLWFLRDLILFVFTGPIWYYAYKYFNWYWILIVALLAVYYTAVLQIYSLFWFTFGGALPLTKLNLFDRSITRKKIIGIFIFLLLCILQLFSLEWWGWVTLKIPIVFLGVLAIWNIYDLLMSDKFRLENHSYLVYATSFTFFIYVFHEPSLNVIRKLIVWLIGKNTYGYLLSYLLSPWIFFIIGTVIAIFLKKRIPKLYGIISGGR